MRAPGRSLFTAIRRGVGPLQAYQAQYTVIGPNTTLRTTDFHRRKTIMRPLQSHTRSTGLPIINAQDDERAHLLLLPRVAFVYVQTMFVCWSFFRFFSIRYRYTRRVLFQRISLGRTDVFFFFSKNFFYRKTSLYRLHANARA